MNTMDSSNIDPNDPVMQAMMKKCKAKMSEASQQMHDDQHEAAKK